MTNAKLCAVVKANAYGHGATAVAETLKGRASMFAVALIDEGISLRLAGIEEDILVLTPPTDLYDAERAKAYGLILSVHDRASAALCKGARVHLMLNTGMNRYGASRVETLFGDMQIEGMFSHFWSKRSMEEQYGLFCRQAEIFKREYPNGILHLSATEGTIAERKYHFDVVRIGIGLYGYASIPLQRAMKVYARCMQNTFAQNGGKGYFQKGTQTHLSTLRIGYGDGMMRGGAYCMDAYVCDGTFPVGEYVCVMDDAEKVAWNNSTIPYEVLTSMGKRGRYVYEN